MNVTYEYLLSQPMFYRFLNAVSDGVFKKKIFLTLWWRKNISFNKDTEKVVLLLWKKGLIQLIAMFRAEKLVSTLLSCTKYPFKGHKILCTKTISYAHFKMERLISGTHFSFLAHDFWKKYHKVQVSSLRCSHAYKKKLCQYFRLF